MGMFENCGDCNGCGPTSFRYPRRTGKTEEEFNAIIEKLKKDPDHYLYEGKRDVCKNKDKIEQMEKEIYKMEIQLNLDPSIHGRGGEA